ncbi:protein ALTERED PHOSPHATE STARVATION RESPONSE 1-like [Curcuma longa]|uniref:protein ALTERED PHOSPHATE STARVATION RESPONSE 1-like n=1 Tax=Curcuma longa TaxID=136217 RepID=UPI003D9DE79B
MGCTYSRVEVDEVVWRCKERRRLMKRLLTCRAELAAAHMAYLQSLRNTGATLRQFTEIETMVPTGTPPTDLTLPPSPPPPPPLPPSPPPPPSYSPIAAEEAVEEKGSVEDSSDSEDDQSCSTPPPTVPVSVWEFWDPFSPPASSSFSSPLPQKDSGTLVQAAVEEEDWEETKSEFVEEEEEVEEEEKAVPKDEACAVTLNTVKDKCTLKELADDNSSVVSWITKDTDMGMVVWRSKKTLAGIIKEVDEYFLKAAAGGKDVAVVLESNRSCCRPWDIERRKGKSSKSAKVVSALSWSWSFRSSHSHRDAHGVSNASSPGKHCTTLEKIFAEEQKLYKQVKDEEIAKSQHKRTILLLRKLEAGEYDSVKTQKTRSDIEELQCRMICLKESINGTCLTISKLRDEELFPQLIEFAVGLMKMWRTMYECHQVQNHVSQQANLLENHLGSDPTTDSLCHAISQLEAEVRSWYSSFCSLFRCQRAYLHMLNQWVRLTEALPESNQLMDSTTGIRGYCEELQRVLDRLPDKVAAEAIKCFLSVIRSIILQHTEEHNLRKQSDRLQSRLDRELSSLCSLEKHNDEHIIQQTVQGPPVNHQLVSSTKYAKLDALRKRLEDEKARYLESIRKSRAMTLNNLQTSLPNVFQALVGFSGVCVQALEGITGSMEAIGFSENGSPLHP